MTMGFRASKFSDFVISPHRRRTTITVVIPPRAQIILIRHICIPIWLTYSSFDENLNNKYRKHTHNISIVCHIISARNVGKLNAYGNSICCGSGGGTGRRTRASLTPNYRSEAVVVLLGISLKKNYEDGFIISHLSNHMIFYFFLRISILSLILKECGQLIILSYEKHMNIGNWLSSILMVQLVKFEINLKSSTALKMSRGLFLCNCLSFRVMKFYWFIIARYISVEISRVRNSYIPIVRGPMSNIGVYTSCQLAVRDRF
ncbi:hypothetical protein QTP88_012438 [Uroleucon formosanum]